ncbi:hypothetical protein C8R44DRAFT_880451 [Mycena epipterygia]|nr:hypothetical protein C8R44DRAFT_880451 [Mycena epipterygia]
MNPLPQCSKASPPVGGPTEDNVGHDVIYERAVAEAHNPIAVAPAWAQGLIASVAALTTTVNDMRVDQLKLANSSLGDGRGFPLNIIPFKVVLPGQPGQPALQDPTLAPHNLPPLLNIDDIGTLLVPELAAYGVGYGIVLPRHIRQRKEAVARAIGYRGDEPF